MNMTKKYKQLRFYLFVNSYSAEMIAVRLHDKYKVRNKWKSKKLCKDIECLSSILWLDPEDLKSFIILNTKPKLPVQRLRANLKLYLEIEKELFLLSKEKLDEYSTAKADYQRQLLLPAIERAAGNVLNSTNDDQEFQEELETLKKKYRAVYYKVAYSYSLPTIRIVPFILRLVDNTKRI